MFLLSSISNYLSNCSSHFKRGADFYNVKIKCEYRFVLFFSWMCWKLLKHGTWQQKHLLVVWVVSFPAICTKVDILLPKNSSWISTASLLGQLPISLLQVFSAESSAVTSSSSEWSCQWTVLRVNKYLGPWYLCLVSTQNTLIVSLTLKEC